MNSSPGKTKDLLGSAETFIDGGNGSFLRSKGDFANEAEEKNIKPNRIIKILFMDIELA